jgi:hypothetical protein
MLDITRNPPRERDLRQSEIRNPVEVERRFQNLRSFLAYPAPVRQHLHEVDKFLAWLGDDSSEYESYLLELAPRLPDLIRSLNGVGSLPESWAALWEKLCRLQTQLPVLATINGLPAAIKKLQIIVASLHAYAGDLATSLALLDDRFAARPPDWLPELSNGHARNSLALIRQVLERAQSRQDGIAEVLEGMIAQWSQDDGDSIVVPVIERSLVNHHHEASEGGLRRVAVKILGAAYAGKDEIDIDARVLGAPQAFTQITAAPIMAGRHLLAETYSKLAKTFFTGKISFDAAHALHEGNSANLAIAALFYCAALRYTGQRQQFHLAANVAITGDLNETGEVLPVDGKSLAAKVQAAFFSWVEYLVVPKSQLNEAEAAANVLMQRFPNRGLTLIGVGHLREIFYDRRLTRRECAGMAKHLARKTRRNKFTVGGMATILFLILVIGKLFYGPPRQKFGCWRVCRRVAADQKQERRACR